MKTTQGNALFLILIAVALFAALSYAVTQSSRGGGGIEREQETLDTAVAQQCQASVDRGIMRLKIIGGCADDQISFEIDGNINENPDNEDNTACFVFHSEGASVTPCGSYLEADINLGQITSVGDTETVVALPNGEFFKCASWEVSRCVIHGSLNGTDFGPRAFCSTNTDYAGLQNYICGAACGGVASGGTTYATSILNAVVRYYADGTTNSDISACQREIASTDCSCW